MTTADQGITRTGTDSGPALDREEASTDAHMQIGFVAERTELDPGGGTAPDRSLAQSLVA